MSTTIVPADAAPTEKIVYRVAEVAKLLGVSRQTIFNRLATGALKARKFGGGVTVIMRDDFLAMLRDLPPAKYELVPTNQKILARDAERRAKAKAAQGIAA